VTVSPGVRLGPYEITALLGEGGMGQVYRATDTNLKRTVAIKVLPAAVSSDADLLSRFRREAEVLARLNHPNIAQIYGLERSDGTTALVMELVEGETLADRITRGSMLADEALPIARQIAEALEVAHEQGIIHRDLKPANVKLRPDGTVKLLDFGLAKALGNDVRAGSHADSPTISLAATRAGLVLGTPAYMSPEQAKGKPVDRRADIWSFGIVLFEMLAGRAVYAGDAASEIIAAVIMNEPDWAILPPSTPPRVRALLRRCLEKAPRSRLQAIGEARIALEGALQGSDESAPATLAAPTTDMTRRATARPVLWSLAGLLVGVLAAGYAAWTMQPEAQRATTRFSIALPDDQRFTNPAWRVLAISPNGDRLVYVANSRLYLRAMSEIEPRVLLGGETGADVLNPVFSPDGQSVAYHAMEEKAIKRLALSGGAAATVCAADVLFGMSWSEHGIVFGQRGKGILRVSPAGGTPEVIVPIDSGHHAASPYMLPGGQAVLFSMKNLATFKSLTTLPTVKLKIGRMTQCSDSGKSQPMPPVAETEFHRVGNDRSCVPSLTRKTGS